MEAERLCGWNWRGGREYPSYKPRTPSSLISSLDKWMKEDFCPRAFTWILVLMTSMGWIYIEIDELNKTRVDREKEKRNLKWKKNTQKEAKQAEKQFVTKGESFLATLGSIEDDEIKRSRVERKGWEGIRFSRFLLSVNILWLCEDISTFRFNRWATWIKNSINIIC